jgi:hypothetical protein
VAKLSIWINRETPKLGKDFESLLDYQVIGDCDKFVSFMQDEE